MLNGHEIKQYCNIYGSLPWKRPRVFLWIGVLEGCPLWVAVRLWKGDGKLQHHTCVGLSQSTGGNLGDVVDVWGVCVWSFCVFLHTSFQQSAVFQALIYRWLRMRYQSHWDKFAFSKQAWLWDWLCCPKRSPPLICTFQLPKVPHRLGAKFIY